MAKQNLEIEPSDEYYSKQINDGLDSIDLSAYPKLQQRRQQIIKSIEVLETDRRKTSLEVREEALKFLLDVSVQHSGPSFLSDMTLVREISQTIISGRSNNEIRNALKLICCIVYSPDFDNKGDCLDVAENLVDFTWKRFVNTELDDELREIMLTGYVCLQYFFNAGEGGIPEVNRVLGVSQLNPDDSASLKAAAINGGSLLLSQASPEFAFSIATNWLMYISPMLDSSSKLKLALALFFAIIIERCDANQLNEDVDCTEAIEDIVNVMEKLIHDRGMNKHEKKSQNAMFKAVLSFVNSKLKAEAFNVKELDDVLPLFLKKMEKSSGFSSWGELSLLMHLKWIYGPGLQTQLSENEELYNVLVIEGIISEDEVNNKVTKKSVVKQTKNLRKEKLMKAQENGMHM